MHRATQVLADVRDMLMNTQDVMDMMGYLMKNRVIFIGSRINDEVRTGFISTALAFQAALKHAILIHVVITWCLTILVGVRVQVATNIVASLLAMEAMNDAEDIKLYINSPGEPLRQHPCPLNMQRDSLCEA